MSGVVDARRARSSAPQTRPKRARAQALLRATRPRQWVKNGLVVAAPFAAGGLIRTSVIAGTALAFAAFVAASAAVYLGNDVVDRERDRLHPRKRHRPIAAGLVRPPLAAATAVALGSAAVSVPAGVGNPSLAAVLAAYLAMSVAYSLLLKHIPGVELVIVAAGFVLRALAGAFGAQVAPSGWFLAVTAFGALTLTFGKRYAERVNPEVGDVRTRPALASYRAAALAGGRDLAASGVAICYLGWVLTRGADDRVALAAVSVVPVVWGLLRYRAQNDRGLGEAPEDLLLHDRVLQLCVGGWVSGVLAAMVFV